MSLQPPEWVVIQFHPPQGKPQTQQFVQVCNHESELPLGYQGMQYNIQACE
jgi:hypothetical protein